MQWLCRHSILEVKSRANGQAPNGAGKQQLQRCLDVDCHILATIAALLKS